MSRKANRLKARLQIERQRRIGMSAANQQQFDQLQAELTKARTELAEANRHIARIGKLEGFNGAIRSDSRYGPYGPMKSYLISWNPEQVERGLLYSRRPGEINDISTTLRYLIEELAHKVVADIRSGLAEERLIR